VKLDEVLAKLAWLEKLVGEKNQGPDILTARHLREFASQIIDDPPEDLTMGDFRLVKQLYERLAPPEELARLARRAKKQPKIETVEDAVRMLELQQEKRRSFQKAGAQARRKNSKRPDIISHWQKLSNRPPRMRADVVAKRLCVTSHYVRKVIRTASSEKK
jgi:hypothetical protein